MVGLSPGNIVLDADPEGGQPPKFPPKSVVAKQLDGSRCRLVPGYEGSPRPRSHCYMGPSSPSRKWHRPPFFGHVYCGQTVAYLSYCWALVQVWCGPWHPTPNRLDWFRECTRRLWTSEGHFGIGQNYSCMMACDHMVWIRTWTGKDSV